MVGAYEVLDLRQRLAASEAARREAEEKYAHIADGYIAAQKLMDDERERVQKWMEYAEQSKEEKGLLYESLNGCAEKLASERAARERAEAAHAGCDAQVRTLVTKALAAVRGQEKAEAERDEAREALADAGTLMGKTIAMSYCTSAEMPERDHTHALPSAMLRVIRERDAAGSRLAAAEKDRDREIEARRAAERATENHAAFALRTVEAEQNLAAAEAALREIAETTECRYLMLGYKVDCAGAARVAGESTIPCGRCMARAFLAGGGR